MTGCIRARRPRLAVLLALAAMGIAASDLVARETADGAPAARPAGVPIIDAIALPVTAEAIKIDGELSEKSWSDVTAVTDFRQREPSEGAEPTHATEVRVLFDDTALYVAVRAHDPEPDKIVGLLTRRDDGSPSDWISILIDSYHDRRT